jgi:hypothetical protein
MHDQIASAAGDLSIALAALGAAYEQLDEHQADELETALFRPVQRAFGTARRALNDLGARDGREVHDFGAVTPAASAGVKGLVEQATEATSRADLALIELQDSLLPVEFGDPELRAALSAVRSLIGDLPTRARDFIRTFGR